MRKIKIAVVCEDSAQFNRFIKKSITTDKVEFICVISKDDCYNIIFYAMINIRQHAPDTILMSVTNRLIKETV